MEERGEGFVIREYKKNERGRERERERERRERRSRLEELIVFLHEDNGERRR